MIKAILIFLLCTTFSGLSKAATLRCDAISSGIKSPTVLFVNGINNSFYEGCNGLRQLKVRLNSNGFDVSKYNFSYFYNQSDGLIQDVNELRIQAAISSRAKKLDATSSDAGYYFQLGKLYQGLVDAAVDGGYGPLCRGYITYNTSSPYYLKGTSAGLFAIDSDWDTICRRVWTVTSRLAGRMSGFAAGNGAIVVAHSQGNFYAEAAYSMLAFRSDPNLAKIRGVGIAAISQKPISNRYLTLSQDNALYELQTKNVSVLSGGNYAPAPATSTVCVQDLVCDTLAEHGENPAVLKKTTGTASLPSPLIDAFGITPASNAYLMHEFVEVYLSDKLVDIGTRKVLHTLITDLVKTSAKEIASAATATFSDDFSGTSLDLTKWTTIGAPPVVSGGFATFSQATSASTIGKYTFSGNKFVVEFASPAPNPGHDTNAALVDVATGEVIQFGDTNYSGWGLYIQATGRYNLAGANINRGADTGYINMETTGVVYNSYKVFRLTVEGEKVTLERGDSASSLNEKTVRTLGATTADRTFYLRISTGGGVVYSPGTFDRVSTTAYQLPGKFSVSALDESTKGYTFTGASTSTCTFNSTGLWGEYLGAGPALALQYDADGIREDGFKSTYPATRVPSANSYSLIVQYRGAWFLAGKIKTLTLDPSEQLFFTINDTPGFFFNNVGQQSVTVSCDPLSISKSLALKN